MNLNLENKIKKLASKFKRPPPESFLKELQTALDSMDDRAVSDAFNKIWKNHKTFPSMAEITRLIDSELVKYKPKPSPLLNYRTCSECENQGWFMVVNPDFRYTTIASCSCPKGVDMRATYGYRRFEDCQAKGYTRKYREWREEQRRK